MSTRTRSVLLGAFALSLLLYVFVALTGALPPLARLIVPLAAFIAGATYILAESWHAIPRVLGLSVLFAVFLFAAAGFFSGVQRVGDAVRLQADLDRVEKERSDLAEQNAANENRIGELQRVLADRDLRIGQLGGRIQEFEAREQRRAARQAALDGLVPRLQTFLREATSAQVTASTSKDMSAMPRYFSGSILDLVVGAARGHTIAVERAVTVSSMTATRADGRAISVDGTEDISTAVELIARAEESLLMDGASRPRQQSYVIRVQGDSSWRIVSIGEW